MKYLKRFNENISIYDPKWETLLPQNLVIYKGQVGKIDELIYNKGNVMLHSDMLQITYDIDKWTAPDTLEIDIYFVKDDKYENRVDDTLVKKSGIINHNKVFDKTIDNLRLDVDITFGDQMACEFSIDKHNGVKLIMHTSYGSKFDVTNTVFAFDEESLQNFVEFLNRFNHGLKLTTSDLDFLIMKQTTN